MNENKMEYFVTRHSKSGKDVESSPGLSEQGVELAKERALAIAGLIQNSEAGSVILLGGVSSTPRTRSTMELYTEEVKKILIENKESDVRFIMQEDIKEEANKPGSGYLKTANEIASQINSSPEQKVVVELPLFLKEFSMEKYLLEEDGETVKPKWQALLDKHGKNYSEAIKDWFSDTELRASINPEEMAKDVLSGMQRLADFSKRFIQGRPMKIGFVGHSFLIDALLTYIADDGKVSTEGFEKIGGEVVCETELSTIEFDENNNLHLAYRGNDFVFEIPKEENKS